MKNNDMNNYWEWMLTYWFNLKPLQKIALSSAFILAIIALFVSLFTTAKTPNKVSNAEIKGEKTNQSLEIRALKEQLEDDLIKFENVKSANVLLDVAPQSFPKEGKNKNKASVILTLMPQTTLTNQELRAIASHVAGAVWGLMPNMVAVSDTTGKLYQSFDPEGDADSIRISELAVEEHIKAKIDGILATLVGFDDFYTTVQVIMNRNKFSDEGNGVRLNPSFGKIESISIGVLIDKNVFAANSAAGGNNYSSAAQSEERLQKEIESQIWVMLRGYDVKITQAVNFIGFNRTNLLHASAISKGGTSYIITALIALAVGVIVIMLLLILQPFSRIKWYQKEVKISDSKLGESKEKGKKQDIIKEIPPSNPLWHIIDKANPKLLGQYLKHEPVEAVVSFFYFLQPQRIASILAEFSEEKQIEILLDLGALDKMDANSRTSWINCVAIALGKSLDLSDEKDRFSKLIIEVLHHLPIDQSSFLDKMSLQDPTLALELRNAIFAYAEE